MQANLARVQDLTDELRRQLKPLGRQAAVARRAAVIQADLRDARLRLLADDLVRLREGLKAEIADEAALKERKEAAEQELRKALQREALLEDEVRQLTPRLQRAQQTWYELSQLAERVRGTVSLADARVKSATSTPPEERRGRDPEDMEREAARIREQEAELEAALEAAERALEDTVAHRAELERELSLEERRLKDVARAIADRREGLARLNGQVNAARSRAASAQAEIDRLAAARDEAQERAVRAQEEYEALKAEVDGLDAGDAELAGRHEAAKQRLAEAEAALTAARDAATAAERKRAATQARHEALALGLRRKDGTGALLAAKDRLGGLLGPAAELLTVTPGHEVALAAAFGAAADAIAVTTPASAADAIRLLRKQDAGRAALLLAGAPEDPKAVGRADATGAEASAEPATTPHTRTGDAPHAADHASRNASAHPAPDGYRPSDAGHASGNASAEPGPGGYRPHPAVPGQPRVDDGGRAGAAAGSGMWPAGEPYAEGQRSDAGHVSRNASRQPGPGGYRPHPAVPGQPRVDDGGRAGAAGSGMWPAGEPRVEGQVSDAGHASGNVSAHPAPDGYRPHPAVPGQPRVDAPRPAGPPFAADLVRGPSELMSAVRRLLRGIVVVGTLEDAEDLVYARPDLTAVTDEGDLLGAHFAQGGSAGAPSLLEVQASVDEAAAELDELAVRCEELAEAQHAAADRRKECAGFVEELGERRRAADREKSAVAQQLGRLAGQARGAAGEAERSTAAAVRAQEALDKAVQEVEELAERLAVAEEMPVEEEPDTSVRDRLAADGANARQTEMEARLQVRTHEERVKGLAGRADSLDRAARAEREARARADHRRARLRHEAAVAEAVASGARGLLAHVEVSLGRAEQERVAAEAAKARREQELTAARGTGRDLKAELDKLTDSVHRGEVLGAEKRLRIEQLETKALEELGVEPAGLVSEYGPHQLVPPSPPAEGEVLPEDPEHPRNQPRPFLRAEQEKRLKAAERAYQQLGKVNPLALEEFAALEERHKFLSEQLEDLKKTRADLLQVVKEVDERVEQVFTEAYRDTAREFEGVFSRLFPGGEGRLVLTDPDNMLTTGVDVEARPPGKKVKRLSLLSGGERSLTAVAMLVSIFKARPSPFYVMDEVEAALDDTNLQRLIRIMQELQEASQLIVITHQKRTMEVADALYGVSMQGDGVSKVISQRLR
jgi:chromosome segregation protein